MVSSRFSPTHMPSKPWSLVVMHICRVTLQNEVGGTQVGSLRKGLLTQMHKRRYHILTHQPLMTWPPPSAKSNGPRPAHRPGLSPSFLRPCR